MDLKSSQRAVGYHQDIYAAIVLSEIPCLAGHCCNSQESQLGRTIDCCPPLQACMPPSGSMNASSQAEGFQVRAGSDPLGPVSKICGAFSNKDLPSIFWRQLWTTAIACVLVFSQTTLTNSSCLVLQVLLVRGSWGEHCQSK